MLVLNTNTTEKYFGPVKMFSGKEKKILDDMEIILGIFLTWKLLDKQFETY